MSCTPGCAGRLDVSPIVPIRWRSSRAGHVTGGGAGSDSVRPDAHVSFHLLSGCLLMMASDLAGMLRIQGPGLRRCHLATSACSPGRAHPGLRRERLRRDLARSVGVGREAPGGQLGGRRTGAGVLVQGATQGRRRVGAGLPEGWPYGSTHVRPAVWYVRLDIEKVTPTWPIGQARRTRHGPTRPW